MVRPWVIRGVSAVAATAGAQLSCGVCSPLREMRIYTIRESIIFLAAIAATCVPLPVRAEGSTAAPEVAPQEEKPIAKERVASFPARGGLIFKVTA